MPKSAVVLFDLDGTVIDSTEAIVESFHVSFKHFGDALPPERAIVSGIGHPLKTMFEQLGVDPARSDDYVAVYRGHYRTVCNDKTFLVPGAKEAVELMAAHARLGVVTTKTARFSWEILKHLGIGDRFETVVGFEEVQNPKPHPEPILLALERLGRPAGQKWMIGDTPMDILAARAAGVTPLGVLSGYATEAELLRHQCDIFDNALKACENIVETLKK
ncbi:MAG: HAD family hydrolase [Campylobacterales bacterium]